MLAQPIGVNNEVFWMPIFFGGNSHNMDAKSKSKEEPSKEKSCIANEAGSDEDSDENTGTSLSSSTSSSSPMPVDDLGPVFEAKGIRAAVDSSVLTFRISRLDDPENRESCWEVTRSYDDFEAFNRLLFDCQKFGGTIFPPLPPPMVIKYEESFAEAPIIHRKQIERYITFCCLVFLQNHHIVKYMYHYFLQVPPVAVFASNTGQSPNAGRFLVTSVRNA